MSRGYQAHFWTLSKRVRDIDSRNRKASKITEAILRHARLPLADSVCLDVGCSSGVISGAIAPLCRRVIGLDYDDLALRAITPTVRQEGLFLRGDAMHLPLKDDSVEIVICAQVYEHVPDDELLFEEVYRVLAPGGMVFFSGPNWLFPIEPHYLLPFLHWLPARWADRYLKLSGKGDHYYERSRHLWSLRTLLRRFSICDITLDVLTEAYAAGKPGWRARFTRWAPRSMWRRLLPLMPNFNWVLFKLADDEL